MARLEAGDLADHDTGGHPQGGPSSAIVAPLVTPLVAPLIPARASLAARTATPSTTSNNGGASIAAASLVSGVPLSSTKLGRPVARAQQGTRPASQPGLTRRATLHAAARPRVDSFADSRPDWASKRPAGVDWGSTGHDPSCFCEECRRLANNK